MPCLFMARCVKPFVPQADSGPRYTLGRADEAAIDEVLAVEEQVVVSRASKDKERLTGSRACAGIDPTGLLLPDVVPLVPAAGHQAALWLGGLSRISRSTPYRWMAS